jgi:hypothetical protein
MIGLSLPLVKKHTFFTAAPPALMVANTSICTLLIVGKIWFAWFAPTSHPVAHCNLGTLIASCETP